MYAKNESASAHARTAPPRARRHEPDTLPPSPMVLQTLEDDAMRTGDIMTSARWAVRRRGRKNA